jgi:ribonuclease T1
MDLRRIRADGIRWGKARLLGLAMVVAASLGTILVQARAPQTLSDSVSVEAQIPLTALPRQGQAVMEQIRQGGPFRYEKDGTVFGNRERLLPRAKRGYYREYTVPTPGLRHRGARRIVCGGEEPRTPDACYYTEDHYSSFRRIVQ